MKLYSGKQCAFGLVAASFLGSVLALGAFQVFSGGFGSRDRLPASGPISSFQGMDIPKTSPGVVPGNAMQEDEGTSASLAQPAQFQGATGRGYTADESENIGIYEKYNESVVNITTQIVGINWFLEPVPQSGGSGSGSIIDSRGYILTNYHVVEKAYKLFVNLADGSQFEARLVGADEQNDLAVLKFDPPAGHALYPIPFGSARGLKVGQKVLAIGNPFGLERTLTQGIVSGLGRPIQKEDSNIIMQNMIQTDASINPGNSGGPLFNSQGQMIGINTMIYSPSGGSVGIGFAIPVDTAIRIVPELIKEGRVRRGWIDMEAIQLFPALVSYLKESGQAAPVEKGLLVSAMREDSNAARAGLRGGSTMVRYGQNTFRVGGDIIISVDGVPTSSIADLYTALEDNKPGQSVPVEFYRGKQKMKVLVELGEQANR
jgi:S1-C subfamily serine protease